MQRIRDTIQFSASDLVGHLNCKHLTDLEIAVANGHLEKPQAWDPVLDLLRQRGAKHEQSFVDHLTSSGFFVTNIDGKGVEPDSVAATIKAMQAGAEIIVQAALAADNWGGRADILRRVETSSKLGTWSYEVIDTKLARETKGGTLLQLCLYSELISRIQGLIPEYAYVVSPLTEFQPERFRVNNFGAYYRLVRDGLASSLAGRDANYPEPNEHCDVCNWRRQCDERRHADDHLSLVAGISKVQIAELVRHGSTTMTSLAGIDLPLPWKPAHGSPSSYERIREQARIQVEGRAAGATLYELLPIEPGLGLARLPEPSPGDVFFDLEGDPFVGDGGLEYLFGYSFADDNGNLLHVGDWSFSREQEKAAFERFVDFIAARRERHPNLHIFHYAPYEPGALKRLMGRYATREEQIDRMLRSELLVDLYGVVRHAIRASVESYSIKKLEPLYSYDRTIAMAYANHALAKVQSCLELGDVPAISEADRILVAGYNKDDCISTWKLRDWLELLRSQAIDKGALVPRPEKKPDNAGNELTAWQVRIETLVSRLTADIPADETERTSEQQARHILAHMLDWHRREQKAVWWEYFRLAALSSNDLFDERVAIAGLTLVGTSGGTVRAPIHRYRFSPQETELRGDESLMSNGGKKLGTLLNVDLTGRFTDIKKRGDTADFHPDAVFAHEIIDTKVLAESLLRIGDHVADHGIIGPGPFKPARDLLLRLPPDTGGVPLGIVGEETVAAAKRIATALNGVLPIQGPPGAGKTFTGASMIVELARAGKRVGITANSHKVIRNLLDAAIEAATNAEFDLRCMHKASEKTDNIAHLSFSTDNAAVLSAINGDAHVISGTAWFWSRPDAVDCVDVLLVDEAAQMSLANVLAISPAARSLVLLGDPQQLEQPMQGSHPEGTEVSALDHILRGQQTIRPDQGLFLDQTWRLHPSICAFTSEMFYEGRLKPRLGLDAQAIVADGKLSGSGLRFLPVAHSGNQSSSPEEAERIAELVGELLTEGVSWKDRFGVVRPLAIDDILIIAPYNAQVFEILERLPTARVGTVDKFQGQEAPIVIYSVTTSSHADAPRGMEFLYSANRLNVATSRAKCLCIVVANPEVFQPQCKTPHQMQLANAFCRYLEVAIQL